MRGHGRSCLKRSCLPLLANPFYDGKMAENRERLLPHDVTIGGDEMSVAEVLQRSDIDKLAEKAIADWATRRATAIRAAATATDGRLGPNGHKLF